MLRIVVAAIFCVAAAVGAPARTESEKYAWRKKLRPVLRAEPVVVDEHELNNTLLGDPCAKEKCPHLTTDMNEEQVEEARAYYVEKHPESIARAGNSEDVAGGSEINSDVDEGGIGV